MASYNLGKVVGDDGVSLEYDWKGTSLGIKRDDEEEYTYVDLKGDKGDTGSTGANGKNGADGYSPTVQTSKEGKTTTIEITDKNGTHTATIQDGADGSNGVDGTSPIATVSKSGNTATITITDKNGTTTASVSDGVNGTDGRDGYVQYTAGSNITIENNVISASGGGSTYFLTTPFTTATASTSLNADDIATLNKAIDDFRAGKDFVLIAKKMMFKTSGSTTSYSYNVNGIMRESGRYIYIDFYRNYGSASGTYPVNYDDTSLTRTMTLTNVSTPANITSASLPAQGTPSFSNNIITIGNTSSYNVTTDYQPAHKKYVDDSVATKQDIIQYSTMPTASSSNVGSIVQFVGTTDSTYTNGYFYKCVEDNSVYSWENVEVQPASSGGDIPIYIWDGRPWSSSTPDTNADVKETWDKVIDCLLNGKPYSFYLIQTRKTGSSASTNRRMVFNITLSYTPTSNMLKGGAICFYSGVNYYSHSISILNALDSNNKITSVPDKTVQVIYDNDIAFYYNGSNTGALSATNTSTFNPTPNSYNPATTKYVDNKPTTYSGYDATKTQVLKNINGTLTWITEE